MRKTSGFLRSLAISVMLLGFAAPAAASTIDAGVQKADAGVVAKAAPVVAGPTEGSNVDLKERLKKVNAAYEKLTAARGEKNSPTKFAWALLIAAIANFLISGIKRTMKLTGRAKRILPWVAIGLGAVGGAATYFATGISLFDSILYGGAAAGAVVLQELGLIPIKSGNG